MGIDANIKKDLKRLGITATAAFAIGGGILGGALPAWAAPSSDSLRFPITMWDYDADNIIFEYDRGLDTVDSANTYDPVKPYSGNGRYGLLARLGTTNVDGRGLVESTLGKNGLPVYKRSTVEAAARAMAMELLDTDYMRDYTAPSGASVKQGATFFNLRQKLAGSYGSVSDPSATADYGTDDPADTTGRYFYQKGWTAEGASAQSDGKLSTAPRAWSIGDWGTLKAYGENAGEITKTLEIERPANYDQTYELVAEVAQGAAFAQMDVQVKVDGEVVRPYAPLKAQDDGVHGILDFKVKTASEAQDASGKAKVEISFKPHAAAAADEDVAGELRVIRVHKFGLDDAEHTVWDSSDDKAEGFAHGFDASWTAPSGMVFNGDTAGGTVLWRQDGNGVKSDAGNMTPLTKRYTIHAGQLVKIRFWAEGGADGSLVTRVTSRDGQTLFESDSATQNAWVDGQFTVPGNLGDETYVDVTVTPSATNAESGKGRVADLGITPLGVAQIGDYDQTVAKFADGTKGLGDVTTCMDYCYYMLDNLWADNAASKPVDDYQNIYLDEDETEEGPSTQDASGKQVKLHTFKAGVEYTGTDANKVVYSKADKSIYNDTQAGIDQAGFFPLDDRGENERSGVIVTKVDGEDKTITAKHNYHFAMKGASKFIYHEGAGQVFKFSGDDDTYLFINGHLALDLGGAHTAEDGEVRLDDMKDELGLVDGQETSFNFFYLERHTDQSNLMISTNIELVAENEEIPSEPGDQSNPGGDGGKDNGSKGTNPGGDDAGKGNPAPAGAKADGAKKADDGTLAATGDDAWIRAGVLTVLGAGCVTTAYVLRRKRD